MDVILCDFIGVASLPFVCTIHYMLTRLSASPPNFTLSDSYFHPQRRRILIQFSSPHKTKSFPKQHLLTLSTNELLKTSWYDKPSNEEVYLVVGLQANHEKGKREKGLIDIIRRFRLRQLPLKWLPCWCRRDDGITVIVSVELGVAASPDLVR